MLMKDKVAVVTGAASGIGKEIAIQFARAGARICIADLNHQGAESAAGEISRASACWVTSSCTSVSLNRVRIA